jgi:MinD-like ATPase involved in chromosome partitioning or flagellar assembly
MGSAPVTEGKIVTFYSYKGGVGRTMALANSAWIMASNGLKVLVVDWDLDSPGLHKYFHPFLNPATITETPGVIDLINDYSWAATRHEDRHVGDWHRPYAQVQRDAISLNWHEFPNEGTLDFLSAGRQNRDYSAAIAGIDWDNFYERLGGGRFFDALREDMKEHYDYTLIDSRTGLSDIADICTVHLPDILVDCFTLNDQSMEGGAAVARNVGERNHYRQIRVLPVPMRVEDAEKEKLEIGRAVARAKFARFPTGMSAEDAAQYWGSVDIPYKTYYAFEEILAVFGDPPGSPLSLLSAFERLTSVITDGRVPRLPPLLEETRLRYKEAYTRRQLPPPADIHLSYVPEDQTWADWISAVLRREGFSVSLSGRGALAGGNAKEEAERAVVSANRTIAIVSAAYLRSPQARGVWNAVTVNDPGGVSRRLIPVRVGEVRVTTPFAERTIVDLTRRDATQATDDLLQALGRPLRPTDHPAARVPSEPRYPRSVPAVWNVPTRNAAFTGRNEALEKLREQLSGSNKVVVLPVALYGLGGVGKTQVALEYAHRYMADYDIVWWISAEQRDLINPALADLAGKLEIRSGDSITEAADAAREALRRGESHARWLLIFDNADDPVDLEPFFPGGGSGHVLVTSRNTAWSRHADPLEIDVFARAESLDLLRRIVPTMSETDANQVAEALGDLPLAIEQAGAWLAETGVPTATYLQELEQRFAEFLDLQKPPNYPVSVAVTWRVSFDRLKRDSPAAARLLELCAFFAPEPISLTLLYSDQMIRALLPYDDRLRERIILGQLIRELARFSLAKVDLGSNTLQVHRLVQAAIRTQVDTPDERGKARHSVHEVLAGTRPRMGDTDDPANWALFDMIWPHLGPSQANNCSDESTRQLLIDRVRYLWKRGEYDAALSFGRLLEEQWTAQFGAADMQTLYLRFQMANALRSQGRYSEARKLDSEVLGIQQKLLTDSHPYTLQTAGSLAGDLRGLGRFRDALEMDRQTYARLKELFGEEHPTTLFSANNLAVDWRLVGDCFRARDLDQETLGRRQVVLGLNHPYSLHSAACLARDLREAGDYVASIEMLRDILARCTEVLGENGVDTLRTAKSLAVALRKMGKPNEAYDLTKETSVRYARNYALDDPDALACQLNLACDLSARNDHSTAHDIANEARRLYELTFGAKHPFTLAAANNVTIYSRNLGSLEEAKELGESTLRLMREYLGQEHPFTMSCSVNVANCLHDLGQLDIAEKQQLETSMRLGEALGPNHPDTLISRSDLAVTMRANGRAREAADLKQQVLEDLTLVLGPDHPSVSGLRSWHLQDRDLEPQPT